MGQRAGESRKFARMCRSRVPPLGGALPAVADAHQPTPSRVRFAHVCGGAFTPRSHRVRQRFATTIGVLLLRFSISQMDVPTRQAYTMAVVRPDERSAAAGVTAVARSVGASLPPLLATIFIGSTAMMSLPFFLAGGLKIVYDVLLYRAFASSEAQSKKEKETR